VKDVSKSDMEYFLRRNGISVITCHAVKPRRSAWQRHQGIIPVDRAAFMICIAREDSDRLLNEDLWPAHVCVSSWRFKKRDNADRQIEEDNEPDTETLVDHDTTLSDQTLTTATATGATVAVAAAAVDDEENSTNDDEEQNNDHDMTILYHNNGAVA